MTTAGAMNVISGMTATVVALRAVTRVISGHGNRVFIYVIAVGMMKMSIMQVVRVTIMLDGHVTAAWSVNVIVIGVALAVAHTKIKRAISGPRPKCAVSQCCVRQ